MSARRAAPKAPHEAGVLRLSIEKAMGRLGWRPRWSFDRTFAETVAWYRAFHAGEAPAELAARSVRQIRGYLAA